MSSIHILNIYRAEDLVKLGGQAIRINSPNMGVVHAITIKNELCWIVYEISADVTLEVGTSIEEVVCEAALAITKTIFLTLHRSTTTAA